MANPAQGFLAGVRILIVDDDESIRTFVHRALSSAGGAVEDAENGRAALQILLRQDFDVVVVDLRMQEMDGITFVQEARNIWPWLGFIIMTGYVDDVSQDQSRRLGISRIVEKPINVSHLRQQVMEEFRERRDRLGDTATGFEQHQRQLRILGHLTEAALASGTFVEALRELSDGLASLMSCDVAGLLGFSEEQRIMVLSAQKKVSEGFLKRAEEEILDRYHALGGQRFGRGDVRVQWEGHPPVPEGAQEPSRLLTIPILVGNEIHGILLLAASSEEAFGKTDVAFMYHTANLLSAVLSAVNRIRQMAVHDALTGLCNRAHLEEQMERAWALARRHGHNMAVMIMDIDHFKIFNDSHGHMVGDRLLREFAAILKNAARATDVVARYGGDEFVIMLPETDLPAGLLLGSRILRSVADYVFCADSLALKLTTSVGVATSRDIETNARASEMLRLADMALYEAKRAGRNCVRLWSAGTEAAKPGAIDETVKGRVLVVDDEKCILDVVADSLASVGYAVDKESSPDAACQRIEQSVGMYDVILTDLLMPGMDGWKILDKVRATDPLVMPIVLTGHGTKDAAVASLRHGAFEFVEKPIRGDELVAIVERARDHRRLRVENERYRMRLEDMVRQKSSELSEALDRVRNSHDFTLQALASLLDARERATGRHSLHVRDLALVLGKAMNLSESQMNVLSHGALLHDIGKIAVPDAILLKTGPLTEDEWAVMRTHPEVGYNILKISPYLQEVAELVYCHQERFDGSGYPRGLMGEAIPLVARIFAVVDAYDAMRSHRPYRRAATSVRSTEELCRHSGTQFDPLVIQAFMNCSKEIEAVGQWLPE